MRIEIPCPCLVALIGPSGSGKSTFARSHFKPTEVLSSDYFRALVSDDENNQDATNAAFDSLFYIAGKRLDWGKLTVIDATNVQQRAREKIISLARRQNLFALAIVFNVSEDICIERNSRRPDRNLKAHVIRNQCRDLRQSVRKLKREGFRYVYVLDGPEETANAEIVRVKLWNDRGEESGPFDIIGDVHGCYRELTDLLAKMNYTVDRGQCTALPPENRKAVFLGDLCDRGPENVKVLRLVMQMYDAGHALCVPGNHDVKLLRALRNAKVKRSHGLNLTMQELEQESPEFRERVAAFIDAMVSHYVLDGGRLIVAHAGISENLQGRSSGRVREFCLYGDTTGETDEFGLPVRQNWAEEYRGHALVVYGHTPSQEIHIFNNTVNIDSGCVFGGKLTCFRYPEKKFIDVAAEKVHYTPAKPFGYREQRTPGALAISDVLGRRFIDTRLSHSINVQEESASLTLEIMSRFSADPRWLIYLPPTMSPCGTSKEGRYLEYPPEAFDYYKKNNVNSVICEEKHMGSRAVIILCRDETTSRERFGIEDNSTGIIYTRTGRHFFEGAESRYETALLDRLRRSLDSSGFWETFSTGWVCLDTELMPWSAKAQKLLAGQYAPVGRAGRDGLDEAIKALQKNPSLINALENPGGIPANEKKEFANNMDIAEVLRNFKYRKECLDLYTQAYRRYCWTVNSVDDFRIAPFHILATENKVWNEENHLRHLSVIKEYMTGTDGIFVPTRHICVDLNDENSINAGIEWWTDLTQCGGEGMVVKPLDFIARGKQAVLQPAVKCRGREYLRIIYGPEYTEKARMERLRSRFLHKKRRLALDEFSLGMEALERFVRRDPFFRVHECVFAILTLENEMVDPRL